QYLKTSKRAHRPRGGSGLPHSSRCSASASRLEPRCSTRLSMTSNAIHRHHGHRKNEERNSPRGSSSEQKAAATLREARMILNVLQIPVPEDRPRAAPKDDRTLFLMVGYAPNHIIMSLALPSFVATPDNPLPTKSATQNCAADSQEPLWFWADGC